MFSLRSCEGAAAIVASASESDLRNVVKLLEVSDIASFSAHPFHVAADPTILSQPPPNIGTVFNLPCFEVFKTSESFWQMVASLGVLNLTLIF